MPHMRWLLHALALPVWVDQHGPEPCGRWFAPDRGTQTGTGAVAASPAPANALGVTRWGKGIIRPPSSSPRLTSARMSASRARGAGVGIVTLKPNGAGWGQ